MGSSLIVTILVKAAGQYVSVMLLQILYIVVSAFEFADVWQFNMVATEQHFPVVPYIVL